MATTRLRKTFRYPADDSENEVLDEEEQEKVITKLREEDTEYNEQLKRIFLAIPTISATTYLPALLTSRLLQAKLMCLLSISSLICTAYILIFVPNAKPEPSNGKKVKRIFEPQQRPIRQYISYLNGGLSTLILLNALSLRGKRGVHEGFWLLCILPAVVYLVTMIARRVMRPIDLSELEGLRYEYKGA